MKVGPATTARHFESSGKDLAVGCRRASPDWAGSVAAGWFTAVGPFAAALAFRAGAVGGCLGGSRGSDHSTPLGISN